MSKEQNKIESKFYDLYGISYVDFFKVGVLLFALSTKQEIFNFNNIKKSDFKLSQEIFDRVIDKLSITYKDFRTIQLKEVNRNKYDRKYEFNCLKKKPIIKLKTNNLIAPSPILVIHRITNGVYYDLLDYYNETEEQQNFTIDYGYLFENYIGLLFEEIYTINQSLISANEYFKDCSDNIPDWIIIENKSVILVECKSSRPPLRMITNTDLGDFRKFYFNRYLNKGKNQFKFAHNHFKKKGYDVYSVIVYNDTLSMYNHYKYFVPDITRDHFLFKYCIQFISISELEKLVPNLKKICFSKLLAKKISDEKDYNSYFNNYFTRYPEFSLELKSELLEKPWKDLFDFEF